MIRLYTDTPFFNDIAEELRLFTDAPIERAEDADAASFALRLAGYSARAQARLACGSADYTYTYPEAPGADAGALVQKRCKKRAAKIAAFRAMRTLFTASTPWGSLTGIRPTRLYRELVCELGGTDAADRAMRAMFDVSEEKLGIAKRINAVQAPLLAAQGEGDMDVYIGIPYCKTRCLYCSFASALRTPKTDMQAYLRVLKADIAAGAALLREGGYRLRCLYMGGGTPTVLTAEELEELLDFTLSAYGGPWLECTVEAGRPDTIDEAKLRVLQRMGVGRISINPQSMCEATLGRIGRSHSAQSVVTAFHMARAAGFSNINMDIIAGLPGEDEAAMAYTLDALAALGPESLTVHTLALKRASLLLRNIAQYPLPPGEVVERMTALAAARAAEMGMQPYYMYRQKYMRGNLENVGYAKPAAACLYNVDMMEETTSIMAHGAGAMSKRIFGGERRVERIPNPKDVDTYMNKLGLLLEEKRKLYLD